MTDLPVPPEAALDVADRLLANLTGPLSLGDSQVAAGWSIESHTIGCRNHADEPENTWWTSHWHIYDEYAADGQSTILGDPADGYFATLTPQLGQLSSCS